MNVRQIEPTRNSSSDLSNRKRMRDNPSIGCQADEAEQRSPGKPYAFRAAQARVPPLARPLVSRRVGVMRVNENVDVGEDHSGRAAFAVKWTGDWPRSPPLQARRPTD